MVLIRDMQKIHHNFKKGSVEMMLLSLLNEGDKYGYEMTHSIAQRSGQSVTIPEGSMYPTLYRLEEKGFITGRREIIGKRQLRIYYHIEPAGIERLDVLKQAYLQINEGIRHVVGLDMQKDLF